MICIITISSFDANFARDPTNIVETKIQDGRMAGPLSQVARSHLN